MDYEFEAFKKGFNDGLLTMWAVFDISEKEMQEKFSLGMLNINSRIHELYQIWQNTIKDRKITREDSILLKKTEENINKLKNLLIQHINRMKL